MKDPNAESAADSHAASTTDPAHPTRREFLTTMGAAVIADALPETDPAAAGRMPPDLPRELRPNGADLGTLFPEVARLTDRQPYDHSFLTGRFATLAEWKAAGREKVLEGVCYRPEPVDPQPEVVERVDCGAYVREKLLFSTSPHLRVPAYVLIPKGLRGRAPAIVDLHSHGGMFLFGKEKVVDFGENHPAMVEYHVQNYDGRPTATELARRGYVVIIIDALGFGERRILTDRDLEVGWDRTRYSLEEVRRLNQINRAKESTLAKSLVLAGFTWPGVVFWDDMRTVDYLVTRPEVDPGRLGCVGISMGGYRSLFLAGLDERIRAACVVGFMSTVRPMIRAHVDTHSNVHFVPALHAHLDWTDVVGMHAPQPLLVQQCSQDRLFPADGMRESLVEIRKIYQKAGAADQFMGRFYDAPHRFTRAMQEDAFAWFDAQLKPA